MTLLSKDLSVSQKTCTEAHLAMGSRSWREQLLSLELGEEPERVRERSRMNLKKAAELITLDLSLRE